MVAKEYLDTYTVSNVILLGIVTASSIFGIATMWRPSIKNVPNNVKRRAKG